MVGNSMVRVLLHPPKVVSPRVKGVRREKCLLFLMMRHNPGGTLKWMIIKL